MLFKVTPLQRLFFFSKVVSLNVIHISMFLIVMLSSVVIKMLFILYRQNVLGPFFIFMAERALKVSFCFELKPWGCGLHLNVGGGGFC